MTKLRLITVTFWLIVNGIALPFLWHQEQEYRTKEYVIKGRGSHAKVIKKSDDPDYYNSRMSYFWVGYIAVPLLGGLILYRGVRKNRKRQQGLTRQKQRPKTAAVLPNRWTKKR